MKRTRIPKWTLLLCGIAAFVFFRPSLGALLIFDRDAIAAGEWWRLLTGNLVHLSGMHLSLDLAALLLIGTIVELRSDGYAGFLYLAAAALVGIAVYLAAQELRYFGGLSGIATAALVYLCLDGMREPGGRRRLCQFGLTLALAKIGFEFGAGLSLIGTWEAQSFVPVPVSHLAGACTALVLWLSTGWRRNRPQPLNYPRGGSAT